MDIRNKRLKGYFILSVLIIILSLCLSLAMPSVSTFETSDVAQAATVSPGTSSVLNLDENGTAQDYFSDAITGEQNEYIYFGKNFELNTNGNTAHKGAIKWRVLSTNSGYSNGNWLLWSDYQVGLSQFSPHADHLNYAYYSTSLIRATLNGGTYYAGDSGEDPSTSIQISNEDSWLNKLFIGAERSNIAVANSIETKCWTFVPTSTPRYATTGIVGAKYTSANVDTMNDRATKCSASISVVGTTSANQGVTETINAGDSLFLLDYYDINDPDYGFGDNGTVYANIVNSTWNSTKAGFPSYNDNSKKSATYLKKPEDDISGDYFLRNVGVNSVSKVSVLQVNRTGGLIVMSSAANMSDAGGVCPAFNFSPSNVIYATAASAGGGATLDAVNTFTSSDGKPAYKVYIKAKNNYVNYNSNSSGSPKISVKDSVLSVEKSGANGSAIILLADKSGSGVVDYQATANFSGGIAKATLPSGVNPRDYSVTVLFTDGTARGENYSESITGSYTVSGHTIAPEGPSQENNEHIKYYNNGNDVFFDLEDIYKLSHIDGSEWIEQITIKGVNYKGETITVADNKWSVNNTNHQLTLNVSEVGKYTVEITPKSGNAWSDGTTAKKTFDYYLKYKLTQVAWKMSSTNTVTYNGEEQYLELTNYDDEKMTISPAPIKVSKDASGNLSKDANGNLWAIEVRNYVDKVNEPEKATVTVKLKNEYIDYLVWEDTSSSTGVSTGDKTLDFTVNKKGLTVAAIDATWKTEVNNSQVVTYDLWVGGCIDGHLDEISFVSSYKKGSVTGNPAPPAPEFVKEDGEYVKSADGEYKLRITLPKVTEKVDCTYILQLATSSSKNYSLPSDKFEKAFSVDNKSIDIKEEDIVWQYKNYLLTNNDFKKIEAGENITIETTGSEKIFCVTYNENAFSFDVDKTSEDSKLKPYASDVDFDITIEGNPTNDKTVTNVKLNGNDVTYYTVKLKITAKTGKTVDIKKSEFTFKWKINKAKFALSDVKWDYDAKTPREYNGGKDLKVSLTGLPAAILPNYYDDDEGEDSNVKTKVCEQDSDGKYKPYTAKVTFKFNDKLANITDIKNNYILPNKEDSSSYICREKNDDGEWVDKAFPWELEWIVKKAELDLMTDWEKVAQKDDKGNVFRPFQVKDTSKATGKIVYEYYKENEWDNTNGVVVGSATPRKLEDIVVDFDNPEKYWVVAKVNTTNSNNYEIKRGTEAKKFTVGAGVVIDIDMDKEFIYDGKGHGVKSEFKFNGKGKDENDAIKDIIIKKYYLVVKGNDGEEDDQIELSDGEVPTKAGTYIVSIDFEDEEYQDKYALSSYNISFEIKQAELTIALTEKEFVFDESNKDVNLKITSDDKLDVSAVKIKKTYYEGNEIKEDGSNRLADGVLPKNAGKYIVVLSIDEEDEDNYRNYKIKDGCTQFTIEITPAQITATWDTSGDTPILSGITEEQDEIIEYVYLDEDGKECKKSELEAGKTYTAVARIKEEYASNYVFVNAKGSVLTVPTETEKTFEIKKDDEPVVPVEPENPGEPQPPATSFDFSKIGEVFKEWWQLIASIISIILMLIFISKTIGYEKERKKNLKTIEKKYSTFYAITLFGLATMTWTMIACVLIGGALLTFIIMLMAKSKRNKSVEAMDEAKEEFERNQKDYDNRKRGEENQRRDEQLQMMLMGMLGGNANGQGNGGQQGFMYQQPIGIGADEIRGIVADTMSNMLPSVQQYLPQEASYNDELVQQLIEQNAQNEERIRELAESNEKAIDRLVEKLSKQQAEEKAAEREVASSNANDEVIKSLIEGQKAIMEKLARQEEEKQVVKVVGKDDKDERIEMLMRNQERLMEKVIELSARNADKPTERLMERVIEMSAKNENKSTERLMEKMIELTVKADSRQAERIIEKPVEKIVEKEVRVEVPVEKPVPMPVDKTEKTAKTVAPRLTLDEAYAKMSASQKKIFDTLKNYALSKDKCKENKSTYFTVLGQSSVNPLVKLTIKKNTTVALFKMEDEYFKDIRKNAGSDGTKMKVKETELVVGDNQALATAKDMIDLREDQIERYNDYLKEQRSMKKK